MRAFRSLEELRAAENLEPGWRRALERVMGDLTSACAGTHALCPGGSVGGRGPSRRSMRPRVFRDGHGLRPFFEIARFGSG